MKERLQKMTKVSAFGNGKGARLTESAAAAANNCGWKNGQEINGNYGQKSPAPDVYRGVHDEEAFEVPLPFGYHLDLDFLRFCSSSSGSGSGHSTGQTMERLKQLRKMRRKEKRNLENLMGIRHADLRHQQSPSRTNPAATCQDLMNTSDFVRDALNEAVVDFERCLQGSLAAGHDDNVAQNRCFLASSTPKTLPRLNRQDSNSSISSISTTASSALLLLPPSQQQPRQQPPPTSSEMLLAGLPSSVPTTSIGNGGQDQQLETESIGSIHSEMSTHTLRSVREHIARSLVKLKEYEKQVEAIPMLQIKLSVLKEEKRLLILKLKQQELKLRGHVSGTPADLDDEALLNDLAVGLETEEDDEDTEAAARPLRSSLSRRARSESPFTRPLTVQPENFLSVQRLRSTSCGAGHQQPEEEHHHHHDSGMMRSQMSKMDTHSNLCTSELKVFTKQKVDTSDVGINTDTPKQQQPAPTRKRDRGVNTEPEVKPASPPRPRKMSHGTNTVPPRTMAKATSTSIGMGQLFTQQELESRVEEAVFRTEEEIMSCPLLQKAMAKVEEEAMSGGPHSQQKKCEMVDGECQVGDEHLKPFVIAVGLQCKLDDDHDDLGQMCAECSRRISEVPIPKKEEEEKPLKMFRSIGVGHLQLVPDCPPQFREVGVCTEKWVEVIKASKQTDTEDFAFKDTDSPRVADLVWEPSPERVVMQRRSSLRKSTCSVASTSPSPSRKSSSAWRGTSVVTTQTPATATRTQGTMTNNSNDNDTKKKKMKDAKVGGNVVQTRNVATSALSLPLTTSAAAMTSPLATPDSEQPKSSGVRLSLCDKCNADIQQAAANIVSDASLPAKKLYAPPSPDLPWLSKIPVPINEHPDVNRIKSATSTGNLSFELGSASPGGGGGGGGSSKSPVTMFRSKSSLTPTMGRKVISPKSNPLSPTLGNRRDLGTPPPHPSGRRVSSPLTRSYSPYSGEKRSLIPKLSLPAPSEEGRSISQASSGPVTPTSAETRSLIPRVATPPALRKMYPKRSDGPDQTTVPDRNVVRKTTYTKVMAGVSNPDLDVAAAASTDAKAAISLLPGQKPETRLGALTKKIKEKLSPGSAGDSDDDDEAKNTKKKKKDGLRHPLPGSALFLPIDENRVKAEPSKEMRAALKVLNDSLSKGSRSSTQVSNAVNIVQQEWFKTSSTKQSNPLVVEDYLDYIEDLSKELLSRVVNLTDVNGNSALHYSVSHGNFDVVSVLLDSKVANANIMNKAGYTCVMLISLAHILNDTHRAVVSRLFSLGDVNIRATQHGQTALMLAVSHGRLDMVQLLIQAGADLNIRDEDGSTALMCAAEHGHMDIVKFLLQNPDTDVLAKDNDGLTALAVAMEAGHRDIGVLLYANSSVSRGSSPYLSLKVRRPGSSRGSTPTDVGPTPPQRSRRKSVDGNNQQQHLL